MNNKKPIKIVLFICLGLYALEMISIIVTTVRQSEVYRIMGLPDKLPDSKIVPWASIISVVLRLIFAAIMLVLVSAVKGRGLSAAGIAVGVGIIFLNLFATYSSVIESVISARFGANQLAALSTLNAYLANIEAPANAIAGTGFIFACGMCVFAKSK